MRNTNFPYVTYRRYRPRRVQTERRGQVAPHAQGQQFGKQLQVGHRHCQERQEGDRDGQLGGGALEVTQGRRTYLSKFPGSILVTDLHFVEMMVL